MTNRNSACPKVGRVFRLKDPAKTSIVKTKNEKKVTILEVVALNDRDQKDGADEHTVIVTDSGNFFVKVLYQGKLAKISKSAFWFFTEEVT